jgi:hypothetical protein
MQIGVSVSHHDHDYVERRGGHVFFSHLRGAPARACDREAALRRAEACTPTPSASSAPTAEAPTASSHGWRGSSAGSPTTAPVQGGAGGRW